MAEDRLKVLFVGAMDVTTCHIASRLEQEGCHIAWITSQQDPYAYQRFRARVYRHPYDVDSIRHILAIHDIDAVIFNGEGEQSAQDATRWRESGIPALQALLEALEGHSLRHLVYLSTVELAYSNVHTPRIAEMCFGENLLEYHAQHSGLPVLIARLGMVYGVGETQAMGYIGYALQKLLDNETIETRCDENCMVDPISADDVAMAVYDLMLNDCHGTYYVLTGHPIPLKKLHYLLSELVGKPARANCLGDEHTLDAEVLTRLSLPLRQETGWMPFYLVEGRGREALRQAVDEVRRARNQQQQTVKKRAWYQWLKQHPLLMGLAEMILLFGLMQLLLPYVYDSADLRYVDVRLLFIMLVALRYGMRLGLLAVALASVSYTLGLLGMGIDMSFLLYNVETWIPFIMYSICGAAIGYSADHRSDMMQQLQEKLDALTSRYDFLLALHKEVLETKNRLQHQLSSSKESFAKAYEVSERLNRLSPDQVLYEAVDVIAEMMGGCETVLWMVNTESGFARRAASTQAINAELPRTTRMAEYPLLVEGFEREGVFVNRALNPAYPDYAAPIRRGEALIAFVGLYHVDAERFSLYHQNQFKVLVGLTENSLYSALQYEEQRRREVCVPDTEILIPAEFARRLELARDAREKQHITYLMLRVQPPAEMSLHDVSDVLSRLVRENDILGLDDEGYLRAVLVNASESDFTPIRSRFAARGMEVSLCSSN